MYDQPQWLDHSALEIVNQGALAGGPTYAHPQVFEDGDEGHPQQSASSFEAGCAVAPAAACRCAWRCRVLRVCTATSTKVVPITKPPVPGLQTKAAEVRRLQAAEVVCEPGGRTVRPSTLSDIQNRSVLSISHLCQLLEERRRLC